MLATEHHRQRVPGQGLPHRPLDALQNLFHPAPAIDWFSGRDTQLDGFK